MQRFYNESKEAALQAVKSSSQGLTQAEARARLERNGKNQLAQGKKDSLLKRFFLQMADPMILILLAAAAISGALAVYENESFTDVIIILFVVVVNAVLGVYQENKAEKAIEALQEMAAATSKVLRDGQMMTVRSEDLVVGDVVLLEAGDAVPADGRILESASLKIEEAALTGESVPVNKVVDLINLREGGRDVPLGDRKNMVYMGSTVVYGRGSAVITATGMDTEMGKIAGALAEAQEGQTPLQRKLSQLSKVLTWLVLGICLVIFGVQLLRAGSFSAGVVVDSFMVAVSLAVAAIPEGLAAVVTVVLSIGVTNMSKRNAIIRRLTAVETLGCAQIICSDKTGTLTAGRFSIRKVLPEEKRPEILRVASLCEQYSRHPISQAIRDAEPAPSGKASEILELAGNGITAVVDGQKAAVGNRRLMEKCGVAIPEIMEAGTVLYVALGNVYLGAIVIGDEPREGVRETLAALKNCGIRKTVMLTGDNDASAGQCAAACGISEYRARLLPQDKVSHAEALLAQKQGKQTLAFVGDGVNDAPVLTIADVGIAMGGVGSDIAVDAADIALVNDEVRELPHLIALSRRMMTTIKLNLAFSMGLNFVAIALAVLGVLSPVVGHNAGSVLVIINSALLLKWRKKK